MLLIISKHGHTWFLSHLTVLALHLLLFLFKIVFCFVTRTDVVTVLCWRTSGHILLKLYKVSTNLVPQIYQTDNSSSRQIKFYRHLKTCYIHPTNEYQFNKNQEFCSKILTKKLKLHQKHTKWSKVNVDIRNETKTVRGLCNIKKEKGKSCTWTQRRHEQKRMKININIDPWLLITCRYVFIIYK